MLEINTASVPEFVRAIQPTEAHFPSGQRWTFRGQADTKWPLTPSIRRRASWEPFGGHGEFQLECDGDLVTSSDDEVSAAESQLLAILHRTIDRVGMDRSLTVGDQSVAFAQHIGLPTTLLDWTRSPLMAAYFAASGAVRMRPREGGQLVVYAMSSLFFQGPDRKDAKVKRFIVPAAANPNMVAQQGEFIRLVDCPDLLKDVVREVVPCGEHLALPAKAKVANRLIAVTLPWNEAPHLLRALRDQGIHAASAYPGQEGVAKLVREVLFVPDTTIALDDGTG